MFPAIPCITPPAFAAINRKRRIRRVCRDDSFLTEVALTAMETHLIAPRQSTLQPALGAKCRGRDFHFFIKNKILRLNAELLLAILTDLCLEIFGHKKRCRLTSTPELNHAPGLKLTFLRIIYHQDRFAFAVKKQNWPKPGFPPEFTLSAVEGRE